MAWVPLSEAKLWDADRIYDVFAIAKDRSSTYAAFGADLGRAHDSVSDWQGAGGEAFHEAMGKHRTDIGDNGRESKAVARAIERVADNIDGYRTTLRGSLSACAGEGLTCSDDWKVSIAEGEPDDEKHRTAQARLQTVMNMRASEASEIDDELATAIRAAIGAQDVDDNGRPVGAPHEPPQPDGPLLVTADQLHEIFPNLPKADAERYAKPLSDAMREAGMTSPESRAAFLATFGEESGELQFWRENRLESECTKMYGPEYAGQTFPPGSFDGVQDAYTNTSGQLGNTQPGDGYRYRGRGPIQLTGRGNYAAAGKAIGVDLVDHPELVESPEYGFKTATWFWNNHSATLPDGSKVPLNQAAESGNFKAVTIAVNGGLTNYDKRLEYYNRAVAVFNR